MPRVISFATSSRIPEANYEEGSAALDGLIAEA